MSAAKTRRPLLIRKPAPQRIPRWRVLGLCLVLAAITFAVFGQTAVFGFVNFDDNLYVYENAMVAVGLSWKGLVWVFTHPDCSLYHPLTMLSLMGDYQVHGLHAGVYHFTNVLFHAAAVILLFLVLRQMTGSLWRSAFVAAVFAVHPLRAESVAWVSERKDVLSAFFFLLTLSAYVHYVRKPNSMGRYLVVAAAFVMALLSKPAVVTLPFVLLLLDYWPLQRMEPGKFKRLVLEKLPLLALAAGACTMTFLAARTALSSGESLSFPARISNALVSYGIYLRQMVFPAGLAIPYVNPPNGLPVWEVALAFAVLMVISLSVLAWRNGRPYLLMGWLWYVGMLVPVIGHTHADRYTYLPGIGLVIAGTWAMADLSAGWKYRQTVLGGLMASLIGVLMIFAWIQTGYWKSNQTLWPHSLACTTDNYVAHSNLGRDLLQKGKVDEAIFHYQEALRIRPVFAEAHYNLAIALQQKGRIDEAITHCQEALEIDPDYAEAHNNLGYDLLQKGRVDEAILECQEALRLKPTFAEAHCNLALALQQKGRLDDAIVHYQEALHIRPAFAEAHSDLGYAFLQKGEVDGAIVQCQEALDIKADDADIHTHLGIALRQKGRLDEAISQYQMALQIQPACAETHYDLGIVLLKKGRVSEAINQYLQALQIEPASAKVQNNLAWVLATCPDVSLRNGKKAVELARQANEFAGGADPSILDTLAAALAEAGKFSDATHTAQKALEMARVERRQDLVKELNGELKRYEAGLSLP